MILDIGPHGAYVIAYHEVTGRPMSCTLELQYPDVNEADAQSIGAALALRVKEAVLKLQREDGR